MHWPFCAAKCPYCDFNSHVRDQGVDEARFIAAYRAEIATQAERSASLPVRSIFFGGGTPSLMSPHAVADLIDAVRATWPFANDVEITLEANPTSVEAERFRGYREAGVNRVSLGVQALNDRDLKALGRLHSAAEARDALAIARDTFDRVSLDLIYARMGQSVPAWRAELGEALALGLSHLSLYQLTIEEGTPFEHLHRAGKLVVPDEDIASDLYALTQEMTAAAGMPAYEISNHAAVEQASRHNLLYWRYGAYAGIGPGAHGRLPITRGVGASRDDAQTTLRLATQTLRHPESWLAQVEREGHGLEAMHAVGPREAAEEMLLMGMRLHAGFDLARLEAITGYAVAAHAIDDLVDLALIERSGATLIASAQGRLVLNRLVEALANALEPVNGAAAPAL
ncbi:MAG: radical SAM family heme chaperone HemW [Pseudomonadota bacterium]